MAKNNLVTNEEVLLKTGNRVYFDDKNLKTEPVEVKKYIAWISGTLVFKNAKFEDMIKILERNYNVTIVVKNKALNSEVFNATFINESIESLLKHLGESYPIKHKIKDNIIYIE